MYPKSTIPALVLLCAFAILTRTASAQSTVFNIASTDVQARHKLYIEADFLAHLTAYENGGYQIFGTRLVYGLRKRTEVGLNAFYTKTSPAGAVVIQPNFKLQLYSNEGNGISVAVGTVVTIPVTHRSATNMRGTIYAVASKRIKGNWGPRLTVGGYSLVGSFAGGSSKSGVLLGYEQPITRKLSFVSDWSSGNNDYGYVVAGVGITLSPKHVLYAGYNVGNNGRGNNSLGVFYGFSF
ncbi:MAG: hypothetical protein QOF62_3390 [Pyrinomonadaceae bacterium]|jgi:hypothetical protein|nr:hypothetical protein [Pyrinomonadaceae bacterium]